MSDPTIRTFDGAPGVVTTHASGDAVVVALVGEFDLTCASQIDDAALAALDDGHNLIIDLSRATFIDSTVLHTIARVNQHAHDNGRLAVLQIGADQFVRRVLQITNLDTIMTCCDSREDALAAIQQLDQAETSAPDRLP